MDRNEEKKDLTGLNTVTPSTKDKEYDLTTALLMAAEFRSSEDAIKEIDITKGGKKLFTLHLHPISDADARAARKKATTYMVNPNGKKLPPIEKEFNSAKFHSQIIYMATTEQDKEKIWGNRALTEKYDILEPADLVDVIFNVGEKLEIVDVIMEISGMGGDGDGEVTPEDYAKN